LLSLCKKPDQLVVDIQLEFGMKVGKTDTERGPVVRRKDREEVVNRRAVFFIHAASHFFQFLHNAASFTAGD